MELRLGALAKARRVSEREESRGEERKGEGERCSLPRESVCSWLIIRAVSRRGSQEELSLQCAQLLTHVRRKDRLRESSLGSQVAVIRECERGCDRPRDTRTRKLSRE